MNDRGNLELGDLILGFLFIFFVLKRPLLSVSGGRFPRARLQPPRRQVRAPVGSSARAVPVGVAAFHFK